MKEKIDGDQMKEYISNSPILTEPSNSPFLDFNKDHSQSRTLWWKLLLAWRDLAAGRPPLPAPSGPACGPLPGL